MSKLLIYAVYDVKAGSFNTPVFLLNDEIAIRNIAALCRNSESLFAQFPLDFSLHCFGDFDIDEGSFHLFPEGPRPVLEDFKPDTLANPDGGEL